MTHVLFIPSWYKTEKKPMSGIFFSQQAAALAKHGHRVGLLYCETVLFSELMDARVRSGLYRISDVGEDGVRTVRAKILAPKWNMLSVQFWQRGIRLLFRAYVARYGRPDIIHAQSVLWGGVVARALHLETGIPYVITEHGSFIANDTIDPWTRRFAARAFRDADLVCAVSSDLARRLEQRYGLPDVTVVPNAVDTTVFRLPSLPRRTAPFRFLSVARCVPIKNLRMLLRGFAEAFHGQPEIQLEICGDGGERTSLETLAATLGILGQVSFSGNMSRQGVLDAMWRSNAYVLTSNYETFSIVLIEALATGLPVISTRCGGPMDIVKDAVGTLVPVDDSSALADAMQRILTEETSVYSMENSPLRRRYVVENFSENSFCDRLSACYERVISSGE